MRMVGRDGRETLGFPGAPTRAMTIQEELAAVGLKRREYEPFDPTAPQYQPTLFSPLTFAKLVNMLLATPLKRVQASPLTWEFVATKARQMRYRDEALEARVVAKIQDIQTHAHVEIERQIQGKAPEPLSV
jgi:hypothetical protein